MKLRLHAIDAVDPVFYYSGRCHVCGEVFVYKSKNSLLKQLWDLARFEMDAKTHTLKCVNHRVNYF